MTIATDTKAPPLKTPPGHLSVVALGDSVTSGYHCYCTGFPAEYSELLANRTGTGVTAYNFGIGGLDSEGLLEELDRSTSRMAKATADADYVLLTIGANDFAGHEDDVTGGRCTTECVTGELTDLTDNLRRIFDRIDVLDRDRTPEILVTGYWNVFKDGDVADAAYPDGGPAATLALTRAANNLIANAAHAAHATYVDLYTPFETAPEITDLLASDGDHPNAAGHALIADLLLAATPSRKITG
nr:SGNH/GDSL hydrolase family protein [Kribbella sandramycini]